MSDERALDDYLEGFTADTWSENPADLVESAFLAGYEAARADSCGCL